MRTYRHRLSHSRRLSPRAVRIGLIVLGLIVLIDLVTARFSAQVQSALTLPPVAFGNSSFHSHAAKPLATAHVSATSKAVASSSPVATASATSISTTIAPVANMLASDTFQRPNQQFWGKASGGQSWMADAMKASPFAIVNHAGQVANGSGIYDAVLGQPVTNSEVLFSGSINHFTASNMGALLRWTDGNNMYKVFMDGTSLIALKKVNSVVTELRSVPFAARDGQSYTMRAQAVGTSIMARVWQTGQAEPTGWTLVATDSELTSGLDGLRLIVQTGITITITSFVESKV